MSRSTSRDVTVIVPTQARRERAASLRAALDSVLAQAGVSVVPLVVVNGVQRERAVVERLRSDGRLRLLTSETVGLPAALHAGRLAVDTPWFADLDDDDLLLPGALALRLDALEARPDCHTVVTSGYRRRGATDARVPEDLDVAADPMRALLRQNWLLPGSYLCRTVDVGPEHFEHMPRYLERTYLALRLAAHGPILWLDQPTVVNHLDTPASESASRDSALGQADALRRILELPLPRDVHDALRARIAPACHGASELELRAGRLGEAVRWHLRSLREPGGWRYLAYTRHLLPRPWTSSRLSASR
jgi:glycosyltransferase involved in cell wall biosynthesis